MLQLQFRAAFNFLYVRHSVLDGVTECLMEVEACFKMSKCG